MFLNFHDFQFFYHIPCPIVDISKFSTFFSFPRHISRPKVSPRHPLIRAFPTAMSCTAASSPATAPREPYIWEGHGRNMPRRCLSNVSSVNIYIPLAGMTGARHTVTSITVNMLPPGREPARRPEPLSPIS